MVDILWKEVELMTSNLLKSENRPVNNSSTSLLRDTVSVTSSMSSGSSVGGNQPVMETFRQIIAKQKHERKKRSDHRLSEITSSIE